jgi:hypothetical protein
LALFAENQPLAIWRPAWHGPDTQVLKLRSANVDHADVRFATRFVLCQPPAVESDLVATGGPVGRSCQHVPWQLGQFPQPRAIRAHHEEKSSLLPACLAEYYSDFFSRQSRVIIGPAASTM